MTRDDILAEIRRTAAENDGKPLGRSRLEQATGITEYDIGRYWARFGDAQREAGFEPNTLNTPFTTDFLIEKFIELARRLERVPTIQEMRLARAQDPTFPSPKVFDRFGSKNERLGRVLEYCRSRPKHHDVMKIIKATYVPPTEATAPGPSLMSDDTGYGFVYLVRGHPGEYKIGRTNLVDRRLSELGTTSPVEQKLVHEFKTDDPAGIEAYWHNRFTDKRMRGEWFRLSAADVKAFKRWRRIF